MNKENYKFTIVLTTTNDKKNFKSALESITNQSLDFKNNVQIIIKSNANKECMGIVEKYAKEFPDNIIYKNEKGNLFTTTKDILSHAKGKYINFFNHINILMPESLKDVYEYFEHNQETIDTITVPLAKPAKKYRCFKTFKHQIKYRNMGKENHIIDLTKEPYNTAFVETSFYKTSILSKINKELRNNNSEALYNVINIYPSNSKIGYVCGKNTYVNNEKATLSNIETEELKALEIEKYLTFADELKDLNAKKANECEVETVIYYLKDYLKFLNPSVFENEKDYNYVMDTIINYIKTLDKDYIINKSKWTDTIDYTITLLKYKKENITKLLKEEKLQFATSAHVKFFEIKGNKILLDVIFNNFECNEADLILYDGKKEIKATESKDFNSEFDLKYGETFLDNTHYRQFTINLQENKKIEFYIKLGKKKYNVKKIKTPTNSKFQTGTDLVGYRTKGKIVKISESEITIAKEPNNFAYQISTFIKLVLKYKRLPFARFLSHKKKKYILINDRQEKACDNGEAIFKYIMENEPELAKYTYFIIKKGTPDYDRLKKYGHLVDCKSLKHKYLFLNAKKIVSSHNVSMIYSAFEPKKWKMYRDLQTYEFIWLQHGITHNDVSAGANRFRTQNDIVLTSAALEEKELSQDKYFIPKHAMVETGMARYDYLENDPKNIITISPTWRRNLVGKMQANGENEALDGFEETQFYKEFASILTNKEINELAKKHNFKINFILHPGINCYAEKFRKLENDNVKLILQKDVNYSEMFNTSKLLITDYSSIFFDFAYLKKPLIYFQFDKDEFFGKHYQRGGFVHDRDGFGDVLINSEEVVEKIKFFFETDFKLEKKYEERIKKTFKYLDKGNCKRVCDLIKKED